MSAVAAAQQRWNDEVLAQPVTVPAWRLWRYESPAVVLGRSQR
ncbi:MAG: ligase, partial [Rubrivivax sp.]|nr:ligase [Rubrivivax sp.]